MDDDYFFKWDSLFTDIFLTELMFLLFASIIGSYLDFRFDKSIMLLTISGNYSFD